MMHSCLRCLERRTPQHQKKFSFFLARFTPPSISIRGSFNIHFSLARNSSLLYGSDGSQADFFFSRLSLKVFFEQGGGLTRGASFFGVCVCEIENFFAEREGSFGFEGREGWRGEEGEEERDWERGGGEGHQTREPTRNTDRGENSHLGSEALSHPRVREPPASESGRRAPFLHAADLHRRLEGATLQLRQRGCWLTCDW